MKRDLEPLVERRPSPLLSWLSRVPWKPLLRRVPGLWYLFMIVVTAFGPVYTPTLFTAYFLFLHGAFILNTFRTTYAIYIGYHETKKHSCTKFPVYDQITQVIVIPNYKEGMDTLCDTLDALASHSNALNQYRVCLAMEASEKESTVKAHTLIRKYQDSFLEMTYTIHPSGRPGEARGKASNVAWAARELVRRNNGPFDHEILTVMDADTCFAEDYFSAVAYHYVNAPEETRHMMMFIPCTVFDRNASSVPAVVRVADMLWSSGVMSNLYPSSPIKIPCSAYSLPLSLAHDVDYWDTDSAAMGEDMHMYLKCFFATEGRLQCKTIYSPASQCNVQGSSYVGGIMERYAQSKRHMWGCQDFGYVLRKILFGVVAPGYDAPDGKLISVPVVYPKKPYSSLNSRDSAYNSSNSLNSIELGTSSYNHSNSNSYRMDNMDGPLSPLMTSHLVSPSHYSSQRQQDIPQQSGFTFSLLFHMMHRMMEAHILMSQVFASLIITSIVLPLPSSLWFSHQVWASMTSEEVHPYVVMAANVGGWVRFLCVIPFFVTIFYYEKYQRWVGRDRWLLSLQEQVYPGTGAKVQPLGRRSQLVSQRSLLGLFDWLMIPLAGFLYLTLPQLHAQVLQLMTDSLDYRVAGKPTVAGNKHSHAHVDSLTLPLTSSSLSPTLIPLNSIEIASTRSDSGSVRSMSSSATSTTAANGNHYYGHGVASSNGGWNSGMLSGGHVSDTESVGSLLFSETTYVEKVDDEAMSFADSEGHRSTNHHQNGNNRLTSITVSSSQASTPPRSPFSQDSVSCVNFRKSSVVDGRLLSEGSSLNHLEVPAVVAARPRTNSSSVASKGFRGDSGFFEFDESQQQQQDYGLNTYQQSPLSQQHSALPVEYESHILEGGYDGLNVGKNVESRSKNPFYAPEMWRQVKSSSAVGSLSKSTSAVTLVE